MRTKTVDQTTGGRNTRVAQAIPAVFQDAAGDAQHPYHSQSVSNLHQSNFQTRANHPGTPKIPRWLLGGFVLAERKNEAISMPSAGPSAGARGPDQKKDATNPISGYEIEDTGTDRRCDRIEGRISSRPYGFARTPAFAEARSKNEKQSHFSTLAIGLLANAKPADLGYPRPAAT